MERFSAQLQRLIQDVSVAVTTIKTTFQETLGQFEDEMDRSLGNYIKSIDELSSKNSEYRNFFRFNLRTIK